jgi:lipopolysaccharide transport system ATP-binding protein
MTDIAVRVENLSKQYRIGGPQAPYRTIRETMTDLAAAPVRRLRRLGQPTPPEETIWALKDVSFDVQQGEVLGIIGRNGAGKSTLLKILCRITEPTEGYADIHGRVGSLLEVGTGFHQELTGRENIYLNGAILGMRRAEINRKFDEIVEFAEIERFLDAPVKRYSSGMYVRLAFAVAAHLDPEILLVDEVLAVGDINFRRKCLGKMQEVTRGGRTVLFVSHDMNSIRRLCQHALWLDAGEVRAQGSAEDMTVRYEGESYQRFLAGNGRFARTPVPAKDFYIERVELRNAEGNLSTQYRYGETLDLVLSLHGRAPQDGFTISWHLLNERGNRISFGTANPLCDVYFSRGDRLISCRIGPLPLTTGTYRFQFRAWVWGRASWDDWDSDVAFQIILSDPFGTGHSVPGGADGDFVLPQTWEVIETSDRDDDRV